MNVKQSRTQEKNSALKSKKKKKHDKEALDLAKLS
jgi:hypothetical protein